MSGELKARKEEDGIVLDLPRYPAHPQVSFLKLLPHTVYNVPVLQ